MKKISGITVMSLFVGTMAFQSCQTGKAEEVKKDISENTSKPKLEIAEAVELSPEYTMGLPGDLKPFEQVELHAKTNGFVKTILVDRGSIVRKGQLLAVLEAPEVTQQYLSAKAEEAKFEQEFIFAEQSKKRFDKANERNGAVAATEIEQALSNYNRTKAGYRAAKARTAAAAQLKSYLRITAPFNGIIIEKNISEGALVGNQTSPLFSLAQTRKLRLTIAIPEKQASSLNKETEVKFTVSSQPGKVFHAQLSRNSNMVQAAGRALIAEFDVDNSDGSLNGGEYAQVNIRLKRKHSSVFVPKSSIVKAQSGTFIWKVNGDQKLELIDISEGIELDSLKEVFGSLKAGDQIIKKGTEEQKSSQHLATGSM